MEKCCDWCESPDIQNGEQSVYWELPDGTRAIEIKETPTIICRECGMIYQEEPTIKRIEDQLFLIDTRLIEKEVLYDKLMEFPRLLKRNYFDFSQ